MYLNVACIIPTLGYRESFDNILEGARHIKPKSILVISPQSDDAFEAMDHIDFHISPRGRGPALHHGATMAKQDWLLFLHDDTILSSNAYKEIKVFIDNPQSIHKAAYFIFKQDETHIKAWLLEKLVAFRNLALALPYGDQGLLIHRDLYENLGGFNTTYPIMEDVDFIRRIGRSRLKKLNALAVTSAVRYRNGGYLKRIAKNAKCLFLYFTGTSPTEIAKIYQ